MKKILLTLAVCLAAMNMVAQEHLTFKGIPIEGSLREFSQKLKAKGFTLVKQDDKFPLFSGEFTGNDVTVGVGSPDGGKNVCYVIVFFDSSGEWSSLVGGYNYYKDLYIRKYGDPFSSKEYNPALSDSNTALMAEVYQGTVEYKSAWEVPGGDIVLFIDKAARAFEGMVVILYYNPANVEAKIQSDLNDI